MRNEIGAAKYPFAPGHEIVGIVTALGPNASGPGIQADGSKIPLKQSNNPALAPLNEDLPIRKLKIGDRVGVGWWKRSCHHCEMCRKGRDNLCPGGVPQIAFDGNNGGFSEYLRIDSRWAIPIPDNIPSDKAAPLFCAGVTVFSPLLEYDLPPGTKVALIGFGGLGHIFVKMAAQMGLEVTVISSSADKEADVFKMGAVKFIDENSKEELKGAEEQFDFVVNTSYHNPDWGQFISLVKPNGIFCLLGLPSKGEVNLPVFPLLYKQRKFVTSNNGNTESTMKTLQFCSKYNIMPETELFSIRDVNKVLDNFEQNKGYRYRAVLKVSGEFDNVSQS